MLILQHPRERAVPIGTAKLAELALPNAQRLVGVEFTDSPELESALARPEAPAVLLFPGEHAGMLSELPPEAAHTLVVIDGTWSQAEKILKQNPRLAALPRYSLRPSAPSRYRIRRAPSHDCISTIEAIAEALSVLEGPSFSTSAALAPFEAMVEQQLAFKHERAERRHFKRPRPARKLRPPNLALERERDWIVAYGEANGWPRRTELGQVPEIVHWAALRLSTGERFELYVAPEQPLAPAFAHHTGLSPERVRAGVSRAELCARWAEFVGTSGLVCVWGHFAIQTLRRSGAGVPASLDLRAVTRSYLRQSPGEVEACARLLSDRVRAPWVEGRTGLRLAALAGVADALLERARAGRETVSGLSGGSTQRIAQM